MTNQTQVQHTPGPWRYFMADEGEWTIDNEEDTNLAITLDDNEADARLIASAPDLLAALEAVLPQYMAFIDQSAARHHHQGDREDFIRQHNATLHAGYEAVRRARGED